MFGNDRHVVHVLCHYMNTSIISGSFIKAEPHPTTSTLFLTKYNFERMNCYSVDVGPAFNTCPLYFNFNRELQVHCKRSHKMVLAWKENYLFSLLMKQLLSFFSKSSLHNCYCGILLNHFFWHFVTLWNPAVIELQ